MLKKGSGKRGPNKPKGVTMAKKKIKIDVAVKGTRKCPTRISFLERMFLSRANIFADWSKKIAKLVTSFNDCWRHFARWHGQLKLWKTGPHVLT